MKRICALILAALLCLSAAAYAEETIEVIKMDGVSVVVLTPDASLLRSRSAGERTEGGLILPASALLIGDEAFMGVAARRVEVSENVAAIQARAFADCVSLREIVIPASVKEIDDSAFTGCENVTVYGEKGTEAERIAALYGFAFQEVNPQEEPVLQSMPAPVVLPRAPLN